LQSLSVLQSSDYREAEQARFLNRLESLWTSFGEDAPLFLEADPQNRAGRGFYSDRFDARVERDLELAGDEEFRDRFINGYELTDVPRFRTDPTGWRAFTESFGRQIRLDGLKTRSQSRVRSAIYEALDAAGVNTSTIDSSEELIGVIRHCWNTEVPGDGDGLRSDTAGEIIANYHVAHPNDGDDPS
jgi:hypothetical protein